MKSRYTSWGLPVALLSASLFGACQNTARGVEADTERNTAEMREEAREANQEMREETRDARQETREAGAEMRQESREAGNAVTNTMDAAAQTMQIKTALIDADNLDAGAIDVDTNGDAKTVTLKGHVPTAAQKAQAERIAKEKAPDYRVVNNLEVRR